MIERYSLAEMENIWSPDRKLEHWLAIEIAACEAMVARGLVPEESLRVIKDKAVINRQRMEEIESVVHHDVIAFLTMLSEGIGEDARYMHLGLTSSDILDTTLGLQLVESTNLLLSAIDVLLEAIKKQAYAHKLTPIIGRSHGIHAEPTTFGLKLALWYTEMVRHRERLQQLLPRLAVGKISGPVGNFSLVSPEIEQMVCTKIGLQPAPISSQIIQRDRHGEYLSQLALLASSLDKFATEVRGLQKTEIREVEEPFRKGQKGSSAMPHKRNPIVCERISGMARLVRANAHVGFENIPLWHERDISHSSVERIVLPDSSHAVYYMLKKMAWIVTDMHIYPETMMDNIRRSHGLFFSQRLLLELVLKGTTREQSYAIVQRNAMKCWETSREMKEIIMEDAELRTLLSEEEINACFSMDIFFAHVDEIFARVFTH